ncbi:MAG: hypothetical protein OEY01_14605 [Desulfobulbaceae bacterium]|nr:hypothetical protein [Desulfobulbaceae bacterium]HIJ79870.1 hypothetical protein [Deltaproteobacteria bacterium]
MDELLQEIKMLPGVKGVFVYIGHPDIIFSDVPEGYDHAILKQIEVSVERIFKMNTPCHLSVNSVEMLFDDTMLMIKHVGKDSGIVALCEPNANFALINMTSNMLISELAQATLKAQANPEEAMKAPSAKKAGKPAKDFSLASQQEPLKSAIPVWQNAMAKAIGPIAEMIVRETVEKWFEAGDCTKQRFEELVNMFCKEIGNANLEKEFRQDVTKQLAN